MGNVKNAPKAPATQIVYVPQPVYNTPASGDGTNIDTGEAIAQQREKNLLSRSRSTLGTILTGFRGILTPAGDDQRKTLLGE